MPFEVFPITPSQLEVVSGPAKEVDESRHQAHQETADRIAKIYENVRERGGEVISSHLLPDTCAPSHYNKMGLGVLYVVAEFPDESTEALGYRSAAKRMIDDTF